MANEWERLLKNFLSENVGRDILKNSLNAFFDEKDERAKRSDQALKNRNACSVEFDAITLTDQCFPVLMTIIKRPSDILQKSHDILNNVKGDVQDLYPGKELPHLRFRLSSLPLGSEFKRTKVPCGEDAGHIIEICGTVIKASASRVQSSAKAYICGSCKQSNLVPADPEQFNAFPMPSKCLHCSEFGQLKPVSSDESESVFLPKDYQEIRLQEKLSNLSMGAIPRSIWVTLDEDLVDVCKPGDDVRVVGVVTRRWHSLGKGPEGRTDIEIAIVANYVQVLNDQKVQHRLTEEQIKEFKVFWQKHERSDLEGRNEILAAFCSQVYGLYTIKLAVCVILCGGIESIDKASGTRVRGQSHLLMVGDPGTGKSQILRFAAKLSPRSVMTSGIGSTNAGLTVSAVRDGGQWSLEAGALVLADGGICCIDEFSCIRESDRVAIHEAMEQQSISVAKAGVVTRLQTRCSVIATANPKGKYDPQQPITVNVGVASPLLSRFDLVFVLLDSKNSDWDAMVASYILEGKDITKEMASNDPSWWSFDKLQAYFAYCRRLMPYIGPDASRVISKYYQKQRGAENVNLARATVRLLQSCIRLAQGHARLMCHDQVTICDAINAISLLELSFDSNSSLFADVNPLHTLFPDSAMDEYRMQAEGILCSLGLHELWEQERERLDDLSESCRPGLKRKRSELD